MEPKVAAELQVKSELITNPREREDLLWALTLVLHVAGGGVLHPVLVARDRIVVQTLAGSLERAARTICPERLAARQFAIFDTRL